MKAIAFVIMQCFCIKVSGWTCGTTVIKVYSRVDTDVEITFDINSVLPGTNEAKTFNVALFNGTPIAIIRYAFGTIQLNPAGVISGDAAGYIVVKITNVQLGNGGIYRIFESTRTHGCSCLYILGIPSEPTISVSSSPSLGGNATLTCRSSSTTIPGNHSLSLMYNWEVGNEENPSDPRYHYSTNRGSLTLSDLEKQDARKQFTCLATEVVSGGYTSSGSDSFSINVQYPPVIGELKNISIAEGLLLQVSCPVTVGNPSETTYEWRRNGQVWKTTQNFTIATTSRTDAMFYTCKVSNIIKQTGSQPISQPDTKSFYLNVWYEASVTEFYILRHKEETSVTMNETESVPFQCNADSNPGSTISIIYQENAKYSQTNVKSVAYSIVSTTCTDSGIYNCVGFNKYNVNNSSRSLNLFINCSPRPSPFVTLNENVTSAQHRPAILTFTTLAYPEPKDTGFKWYRWNNNVWLTVSDNEQFQVETSNLQTNLTITDVNRTYFGKYKLEVENTVGRYEQIFHLSQEDRAYVTSFFIEGYKGQTSISVPEDHEDVQFVCSIDGHPASTIKIMFEGKVLKEESNTKTLTFMRDKVSCLDSGIYTCEGSNDYGPSSHKDIKLFVICPPRPLHQMKLNVKSSLHVPVTLMFTALAYPPPGPEGFTWHKQNDIYWTPLLSNVDLQISSSAFQSNLTILSVSDEDFGHYRMNVSNNKGSYVQYWFLTERASSTTSARNINTPIVISLGILCAVLAVYAVSVSILYKRKSAIKGTLSPEQSTEQRTYVNTAFKSNITENQQLQDEPGANTRSTDDADARREEPVTQYNSLDQYSRDDRTIYNVL